LVLRHGHLLRLSHFNFISLISLVDVETSRWGIVIFESLNQYHLFFIIVMHPWLSSCNLLRIRSSRYTSILNWECFTNFSHILFSYIIFEVSFASIFPHLMIGGLLIFLENFLFIIKRLFFHKYMLLTATSTAKWSTARYWRKTAARASTAAHMMPCTHCRPITWPTILINCLKNGLEVFVFRWCGCILWGDKRIADIVGTDRGFETFVSTTCDSSWWNNWVFSFTRRWFRSRGLTHFTVRRILSVILRGMLSLPKLSQLKVFFKQSIHSAVRWINWHRGQLIESLSWA
jgi:hypothetical protein